MPFSEHRVLDARGVGRMVGCSLLVRNPTRVWWGEGDEKIYVDGEQAPSWFGTGMGRDLSRVVRWKQVRGSA